MFYIVCTINDLLLFPSWQTAISCNVKKNYKTFLHISEKQWGQVPGGPGGALLQPAQRQEAGADDQVHKVPDPVQSRWPHQGDQQHPDRGRGGGRSRSEELNSNYTSVDSETIKFKYNPILFPNSRDGKLQISKSFRLGGSLGLILLWRWGIRPESLLAQCSTLLNYNPLQNS